MEERGENPNLKLIFEKGPRKGETLDCPHGSNVRIGRVIRGNTFTIKDPAISQNHLLIQSDGSQWSISDLDTSNGTFLNDARLRSNSPFHLAHGDTIKIGTTTSITVSIDRKIDPELAPPPPRRNMRRQPAAARARVSKKDQIAPSESHQGEKMRREETGVGEEVNSIAVKIEEKVNLEMDPPRIEPRRNPRRRAAAGVGNSTELRSEGSFLVDNVGAGAEITSISAKGEEKEGGLEIPPVPRNTRHRAGKVACKEKSAPLESNLAAERGREPEKVDTGEAVDENPIRGEDVGIEDKRNELENITLGDWFDRMEKYLPRKVNEAADEIIASLRQRQKQFEEFITERQCHRNGNGELPVAN